MPMPSRESSPTASAMTPRRVRTGALTTPSWAVGGSSDIGARAARARSASAGSSSTTSTRSPPTRSLSSSEVPEAITSP